MDEPSGVAPNPIHPASTQPNPYTPPSSLGSLYPDSQRPKVDHLYEIAELARGLHNVSPSGAETVSAKILEHIAALQEGKA